MHIFTRWKSTVKLNKPVKYISFVQLSKLTLCLVVLLSSSLSYGQEVRSIDGTSNNIAKKYWGAAGGEIIRVTVANYLDGSSLINDQDLPNPRKVSNEIFAQEAKIDDLQNHSDFVWAFGQFLDHDITLIENGIEPLAIEIPQDDQHFTPGGNIFMFRSEALEGTGSGADNPRLYENHVTAFVDGSAIYGSDIERADWLRANNGKGKLKVSQGNLLPWNTTTGERNNAVSLETPFMADDTDLSSTKHMFVAGDVRANENPLLTAIHTLFVREHNRLCDYYSNLNPQWNGEQLYQKARKMIGAYIQSITYEEWLPSININIPEYNDYRDDINPNINNVFSAAAFRMGHTLINGEIIRMDNDGDIINLGNINLKDAFFQPREIIAANGIEPYIKGMATQVQQEMDAKVINDVRNFLFADGPNGGLDLAAININRGRERGLADYNTLRDTLGLTKISSFESLTDSAQDAEKLKELYGSIDNLDAWVGMLAEKHQNGSMFGELVNTILERQFQNLRDGDRFYYENDPGLTDSEKEAIKSTRLHDIIMRNCAINTMQYNVFTAMPHGEIPDGPDLPNVHLEAALYPNPVGSYTELKVIGQTEEDITITIQDITGKQLMIIKDRLVVGPNYLSLTFDNVNWGKGMYTVLLQTKDKAKALRFFKN